MLRCPACGTTYRDGADEPWRCSCGSPLEFAERPLPGGSPPAFGSLDARRGLWAFESFLAVEPRVALGEGFTPLVEAPAWDAAFKLEYVSPTGSFKDRGAAATISRALDVGADRVLEDSSGNAGAAIAAYAARAGLDAEVYVPADAAPAKVRAIERTGARVVRIDGAREDATAACIERVEADDGWYASHAWNPAFLAGTATFAIETCAQRDWSAPDAVVLPVGHGTLLLGARRGFGALEAAGWIDEAPRLLAAGAAGYTPFAEGEGRNEAADGIRVREPAREAEIRSVIAETGGAAVAVGEAETREACDRLRERGFGVEPTAAVGPAALERYRERGDIGPEEDVVVPLTGRAK